MDQLQLSRRSLMHRSQSTGSVFLNFWSNAIESPPTPTSSSHSLTDQEFSALNDGSDSDDGNAVSYLDECSVMVNVDDEYSESSKSKNPSLLINGELCNKGAQKPSSLSPEVCEGNLDFFADSPFYDAFIEKELKSLDVSADLMIDIASKTKEFAHNGIQMVRSTRRLARSCRVGSKRAVGNLSFKENKEKREKTLGHDIANAFEHLGDVLDEIATAQEHMCEILEKSLVQELESFAGHTKRTSQMRAEAENETNKAEQLLFKYLNGKNAGGNFEAGVNTINNASHNFASKAIKVARWNHNIQTIRVAQTSAEMQRFQLSKRIVDLKHEQNFKLSTSATKMLSEMHTFLCHCSKLVSGLTPKMGALEGKCQQEQDRYESSDVPLWQERENKFKDILTLMKKAENDSKQKELIICNEPSSKLTSCDTDFQTVELKSQIWMLPTHLASQSRYHRVQASDVLAEGWLYQKKTSSRRFIAKEEWKRRWIILRNDGIFCFSGKGKEKSDVAAMEQKICEVDLCTTRKLDNNKFPSARFCFELVGPKIMHPVLFQARGPYELQMWVERIRSATAKKSSSSSNTINHDRRNLRRLHVSTGNLADSHHVKDTIMQMSNFSTENLADYSFSNMNGNVTADPVVEQIMKANPSCADCGKDHPDWAVINLGIVICLECSGVHRSLGVHISKVRSLTLDSLSNKEAKLLLSLGNDNINEILEEKVPHELYENRRTKRGEWIKRKYVQKEFVGYSGKDSSSSEINKGHEDVSCRDLYDASKRGDVMGVAKAFIRGGRVDWKNNQEGAESPLEVCGLGLCDQLNDTGTAAECKEFLLQNGAKTRILMGIEEYQTTKEDETSEAA